MKGGIAFNKEGKGEGGGLVTKRVKGQRSAVLAKVVLKMGVLVHLEPFLKV